MQTLVVDHPLIAHKLTALRDEHTEAPTFRRLTDELVTLLAYEATRAVRVLPVSVRTPVDEAHGVKLARPVPLVVPVLRAGIGMLEGMTRLLPTADVGFVGLARDEESLVATTYANRLPADLTGRDVFVLDPMLATGGTLETVIRMLAEPGRRRGYRDLPARRARGRRPGSRRPSPPTTRSRSGSSPRRWTTSSTSAVTSCPASATRATACSARSDSHGGSANEPRADLGSFQRALCGFRLVRVLGRGLEQRQHAPVRLLRPLLLLRRLGLLDADRVPDGLDFQERQQPGGARRRRPVVVGGEHPLDVAGGQPLQVGPGRRRGTPVRSIAFTSMCPASTGASSAVRPVSTLTTPPGRSEVASTSASVIAGSGRSRWRPRPPCCRSRSPARRR